MTMNFNKRQLQKEADKYHYIRDTYEKVIRLVDILSYIRMEPDLFNNLALKGGTAINLTIFDLPRLSVDIDLDFTINSSREEMMQKRKRIKELLVNYLEKNGYKLDKDTREHHALDSLKQVILMPEEILIPSKLKLIICSEPMFMNQ